MNDKQKEQSRRRQQRYRDQKRNAAVTKERNVTGKNVTLSDSALREPITLPEMPKSPAMLPASFGQPDCTCQHCSNNRRNGIRKILNHGPTKTKSELAKNELNRVSLPGDVDYKGVAV